MRERAARAGALVGVAGRGLGSLAEELAGPELARRGLCRAPAAVWQAVVAQVVHDARDEEGTPGGGVPGDADDNERPGADPERQPYAGAGGRLGRFGPISEGPGLARRLASTFGELRAAGVTPERVAGSDRTLAGLYRKSLEGLERAGFVDRAGVLEAARRRVESGRAATPGTLLLLDAPFREPVVRDFVAALAARASRTLCTLPEADRGTARAAAAMGAAPPSAFAAVFETGFETGLETGFGSAPSEDARAGHDDRRAESNEGRRTGEHFPGTGTGAKHRSAARTGPDTNKIVAALQRRLFRPEADSAAALAGDAHPSRKPAPGAPGRDRPGPEESIADESGTKGRGTHEPGPDAAEKPTPCGSPGHEGGGLTLIRAPGAAAEALEIARAFLREAERGLPFDRMAVLLADPGVYAPALREAFDRARIPAFFETGAPPADRAGRAFLTLLDCALDDLSADTFFAFLTLGEHREREDAPGERAEDGNEGPQDTDDPNDAFAILRRQEQLVLEARVIGGLERWQRRLERLAEQLQQQRETASDRAGAEAEAAEAARRERALARFRADFLPLLKRLAALPKGDGGQDGRDDGGADAVAEEGLRFGNEIENDAPDAPQDAPTKAASDAPINRPTDAPNDAATRQRPAAPTTEAGRLWGEWAKVLSDLARSALRRPEAVLRCLEETAPLAQVGPLTLAEVRAALGERLLDTGGASSGVRYGRVFVAPLEGARGLSFPVVAIPGLSEGAVRAGLREDPILPDRRRRELDPALRVAEDRLEAARRRLATAVGAATERVLLSCSSLDVVEGRPLTPSYSLVEALRAGEGRTLTLEEIVERARRDSGVTPGLRAPQEPEAALDRPEFDLSLLGRALAPGADPEAARGAGAYLLRDERLAAALRREWMRNNRGWQPADGFLAAGAEAKAALGRHRPTARIYSATGLEAFAACPYRFFLKNIVRLRASERPERLVGLDPLTRGSLVHDVFFRLGAELRERDLTPLRPGRLAEAVEALREVFAPEADRFREETAPAIDRIWNDQLEGLLGDLRGFLEREADNGFRVAANELTFGMTPSGYADPGSQREPAILPGGLRLRGSIDAVEEKADGSRRVTDYKTGQDSVRAGDGKRVLFGGEALQPLLYAFAQEAVTGKPTASGRLYYTTLRGAYHQTVVETDTAEARTLLEQFVRLLDEAITAGRFPAAPNPESRYPPCRYCDYLPVCGPRPASYRDTKKPHGAALAEVQAIRKLP